MLFGTWSRKMNHTAMPRQASICKSRAWPFSSGGLPNVSLAVAVRSCIWVTPSRQDGPAAGGPDVSSLTFGDLFLRCHFEANLRANVELGRLRSDQLSPAISPRTRGFDVKGGKQKPAGKNPRRVSVHSMSH